MTMNMRFEKEVQPSGRAYVKMFKGDKQRKYYSFKDEARADAWIADMQRMESEDATRKQAKKQALAQARATLVNPYKVGDVMYNSWGWEQTNIDWYQVTAVGPKSVEIRPIAAQVEEQGFMQGPSIPVMNQFKGDAIKKVLQVSVYDGRVDVGIAMRHGSMSAYEGKPVRCSWYA